MITAVPAVSGLASGEPPINFAAHQFRAGNMAGARDDFEHMLAAARGLFPDGGD